MLKQNNDYFQKDNPNIYKNGCYFLSLIYAAEYFENGFYSITDEQADLLYSHCVRLGYMKENCFILSPAAVFNLVSDFIGSSRQALFIGRELHYNDVFEPGWTEADIDMRIQHLKRPNGYHFRFITPEHSIVDPWYPSLPATKLGYRYFKLSGD